jgi:TRAP-type mannitol/chloroaromatic compound transport system substrate-binding protein
MGEKQMNFKLKRRKFLKGTAVAAALGAPAIARAQGPIVLRFQSSWPAKSLFHEYALDYGAKVNGMTGGDVRIDVLAAGSVATQLGLLDAVGKGALDGAHGLLHYHYGRHPAFALWAAGPAFGMDANLLLAWHRYGGGKELLAKLYAALGASVVSFPYGPMPAQPLGWFEKPIARPQDFRGLRFRTVGMAIDIYAGLGAKARALPAEDIAATMRRGELDGAEFNNPASDAELGLPEVAKVYMLQSYHQSAEQFEILFNKIKFEALPSKIRAILEIAADAASADMAWKAVDRYSAAHARLQAEKRVRMAQTPDAVLQRQLTAYDDAAAKRQDNALFREIQVSQRRFAQRAVRWQLDTQVSPRLAYDHYFGRKPGPRRKK